MLVGRLRPSKKSEWISMDSRPRQANLKFHDALGGTQMAWNDDSGLAVDPLPDRQAKFDDDWISMDDCLRLGLGPVDSRPEYRISMDDRLGLGLPRQLEMDYD